MAKFEMDEFEERLTDNCVQQIEINTKKDTACFSLCIHVHVSLIWTLYFNVFQGCGAYKLVGMYLKNVMGMLIWLYELFYVAVSYVLVYHNCSDDFVKLGKAWKGGGILRY